MRTVNRGNQRAEATELHQLTTTLAAVMRAGLTLSRALGLVAGQLTRELAAPVLDVRRDVDRGHRFSDALASTGLFPVMYIGMVRAGEASGDLPGALELLAQELERERTTRAKLISALIYPAVLAGAGLLSMVVLFVFVIPRFATMLVDAGATMTTTTHAMIAVSTALQSNPITLVIGALLLLAVGLFVSRWPPTQQLLHRGIAAAPIVGPLRRDMATARFARVLAALLSSGAPLARALDDTLASLADDATKAATTVIRKQVREGASLAAAIKGQPIFPLLLAQLVGAGEESGRVPQFLDRAAAILEERADRTRERALALVEPLMIVVFGGVIGFVALSLLQAIYSINATALR